MTLVVADTKMWQVGKKKHVSTLLTKERHSVQSAVRETELFILPLSVTAKGIFIAEF